MRRLLSSHVAVIFSLDFGFWISDFQFPISNFNFLADRFPFSNFFFGDWRWEMVKWRLEILYMCKRTTIVFVSSDGDKTSILLLSTSIQRKIFSAISSTSANPLPHTSHINHNKSSSFDLPVWCPPFLFSPYWWVCLCSLFQLKRSEWIVDLDWPRGPQMHSTCPLQVVQSLK